MTTTESRLSLRVRIARISRSKLHVKPIRDLHDSRLSPRFPGSELPRVTGCCHLQRSHVQESIVTQANEVDLIRGLCRRAALRIGFNVRNFVEVWPGLFKSQSAMIGSFLSPIAQQPRIENQI